jgi:hypothetical protein
MMLNSQPYFPAAIQLPSDVWIGMKRRSVATTELGKIGQDDVRHFTVERHLIGALATKYETLYFFNDLL